MEPLYDPDPDEIIQSKIKNAQSSLFTLSDLLADLAADRTAESSVILAELENLARVLIQRMHEIKRDAALIQEMRIDIRNQQQAIAQQRAQTEDKLQKLNS
jgi:hypothetical protein